MPLSIADLAARMRDIDTCLLCTTSDDGLDARPMSNNRDVEWDGTSWFFAMDTTGLVQDVQADPRVLVTYTGQHGFWLSVRGTAAVHRDRALLAGHWDAELVRWYPQGPDTPGLCLVQVSSERIRYWTWEDGDGEISL